MKPGRKTIQIDAVTRAILVSYMEKHALSFPAFGTLIGISRYSIYNIISGRSGMTQHNAKQINRFIQENCK